MNKKKLITHLQEISDEKDLRHLVIEIANATKTIARKCRYEFRGKADTENTYGERQLELDILADKIITDRLMETGLISTLASEEKNGILESEINKKGKYAVAFDPLDGSSLVDVNFAVGSIFAIFKADNFIGQKGKNMACALYALYGPQTTFVLSLGGKVHEYRLNQDNEYELEYQNIKIKDTAKNFAPGNLRACNDNKDYKNKIIDFMDNEYTLRYSGGMVPDINHILIKNQGIFTYPPCKKHKNGKLRLLFECAPLSFIIETAEGKATNGKKSILDLEIKSISDRTPIFIGSKNEVEKFTT